MFFSQFRTYKYSVDINNATKEAVFDYAAAPAYWPFCHPSSVEVIQVEEPPTVDLKKPLPLNMRVMEITQLFILRQKIIWICTENIPGTKFVMEGAAFGAKGEIAYTFEDNQDGSVKFTREFNLEATNILTRVGFWFLNNFIGRDGKKSLATMMSMFELPPTKK